LNAVWRLHYPLQVRHWTDSLRRAWRSPLNLRRLFLTAMRV
jgi:hypothetical protein